MKKLLFILLCLPMIGFGQLTYVPDDNFEAYLEANGMGNGIANDDYVTTANISSVTHLWVNNESISDLTGIEGFSSLELLSAQDNNLTSIDLSNNLFLEVLEIDNNNLSSLDFFGQDLLRLNCNNNQITNLSLDSMSLTTLAIGGNPITNFDATLHPDLETLEIYVTDIDSIDLSQNPNLEFLSISGGNLLSLDLSNNPQLTFFDSWGNSFVYLDVRNGNNHNMSFVIGDAYNLTCINVDDENWANANWFLQLNSWNYFSNNCSGTSIQEHTANKELLKVTDLLGRETKRTNQSLLYIYDDGTVKKKIIIE